MMQRSITLMYFLIVGTTVLIQISLASHDIINELDEHHGHTVDLGSYVGKHKIPPKVIHITKTVAVKVPVPYPVKVPYHVPYPVEVIKPYPVPVPKYIKIKEQVPIEVPVHSGHGGGGGGYSGGASEHASISEYQPAHEEYSGSQYAGQIIADGGAQYGHEGQGGVQYGHEGQGGVQYGHEGQGGEVQQEALVQHDIGNEYGGQGLQGQYSAQQLIYSSPRFGINAYYSQNGSPDNNEKSYKYEANNGSKQEKIENTSSNYSSGSEYNYNQNGQPQQQQQIQHISNTNVNQQIYTQGSAPIIHQPQFAEASPGTLQANQEGNQHHYY